MAFLLQLFPNGQTGPDARNLDDLDKAQQLRLYKEILSSLNSLSPTGTDSALWEAYAEALGNSQELVSNSLLKEKATKIYNDIKG